MSMQELMDRAIYYFQTDYESFRLATYGLIGILLALVFFIWLFAHIVKKNKEKNQEMQIMHIVLSNPSFYQRYKTGEDYQKLKKEIKKLYNL